MTTDHAGTVCRKCWRPLKDAVSTTRGYGPKCWKMIQRVEATELRDFSKDQLESARQLLEDFAAVAIRPHIFRVVSTDGSETHLTAAQACTCTAGLKAVRPCYHQAVARMLLAA